jgi:hypothetical protein
MTTAGDRVKFWRNKRPLTMSDYQEAVVVAVGPLEVKPPAGERALAVTLAAGEFWLSVRNTANGRDFRVVARECGATPEPGCFTNEKPVQPEAKPQPAKRAASVRVSTEPDS